MRDKRKTYSVYNDELEIVKRIKLPKEEEYRIGVRRTPAFKISLVCLLIMAGILTHDLFQHRVEKLNAQHQEEFLALEEEMGLLNNKSDLNTMIGECILLGAEKVPGDSVVYAFIRSTGVWYPEVIMAQYVIESHGTSNVVKKANNCFGMKKIKELGRHRPTTQRTGVDHAGYGCYVNWRLSVIDRVLWDYWVFRKKPGKDKYINTIGSIYAEDPDYISKIKKESARW